MSSSSANAAYIRGNPKVQAIFALKTCAVKGHSLFAKKSSVIISVFDPSLYLQGPFGPGKQAGIFAFETGNLRSTYRLTTLFFPSLHRPRPLI